MCHHQDMISGTHTSDALCLFSQAEKGYMPLRYCELKSCYLMGSVSVALHVVPCRGVQGCGRVQGRGSGKGVRACPGCAHQAEMVVGNAAAALYKFHAT